MMSDYSRFPDLNRGPTVYEISADSCHSEHLRETVSWARLSVRLVIIIELVALALGPLRRKAIRRGGPVNVALDVLDDVQQEDVMQDSETLDEQLGRVRAMVADDHCAKWDLSDNDRAALAAVLAEVARHRQALAEARREVRDKAAAIARRRDSNMPPDAGLYIAGEIDAIDVGEADDE